MAFIFDLEKNRANMNKHGIDFRESYKLWDDPGRKILPGRSLSENRSLMIARLGEKHWTAIFTERDDSIRIISVRRARKKEIELYHEQ